MACPALGLMETDFQLGQVHGGSFVALRAGLSSGCTQGPPSKIGLASPTGAAKVVSVDAVTEFPFVQKLPARKQSAVSKAWDVLRRLQATNLEEGGLLPVMVAAKALNVSRTRIDQLVGEGRLRRVEVEGHVFIGGRSVAQFAWDERKQGRRTDCLDRRTALDIVKGVASEKL